MSKRVLSVVSILFLSSIFVLSCSNAYKTGDGTQTVQGIAKYAGTWNFQETTTADAGSGTIIICQDGSVNFEIEQQPPYTSKNVTDKGNETYDVIFSSADVTLTLTLTFKSDTEGSYEAKYSGTTISNTGTLTKQ